MSAFRRRENECIAANILFHKGSILAKMMDCLLNGVRQENHLKAIIQPQPKRFEN